MTVRKLCVCVKWVTFEHSVIQTVIRNINWKIFGFSDEFCFAKGPNCRYLWRCIRVTSDDVYIIMISSQWRLIKYETGVTFWEHITLRSMFMKAHCHQWRTHQILIQSPLLRCSFIQCYIQQRPKTTLGYMRFEMWISF